MADKMIKSLDKVRVDKWVWAVRLSKTRSLAGDACRSGRIWINDIKAKPSDQVKSGDWIRIKRYRDERLVKVLICVAKRLGAPLAVTCYEDHSPKDDSMEMKLLFRKGNEQRERGSGRPTKRDRRDLDDFKDQKEE